MHRRIIIARVSNPELRILKQWSRRWNLGHFGLPGQKGKLSIEIRFDEEFKLAEIQILEGVKGEYFNRRGRRSGMVMTIKSQSTFSTACSVNHSKQGAIFERRILCRYLMSYCDDLIQSKRYPIMEYIITVIVRICITNIFEQMFKQYDQQISLFWPIRNWFPNIWSSNSRNKYFKHMADECANG